MRNITHILSFFLVFSIILPFPSNAHVLETDGSIGAVLHVHPEDDPIVGELSTLTFAIKDKNKQFSFAQCLCTVKILQQNKQIVEEQITNETYQYVFPQKGIYQITLSGHSRNNSFKPFSLSYDVRVAKEASIESSSNFLSENTQKYWLYPVIGLSLVGIIISVLYNKKK